MKNFLYIQPTVLMLAAVCLLMSCKDDMDSYDTPNDTSHSIMWNVVSSDMKPHKYVSRSMIENDNLLREACTDGLNAIGIWSAYELDGSIRKNVLGNDHGDVSLIYREGTSWDNYNGWSYGETAVLWEIGAKYTFNAYFPKHVVTEISTSDISTFVVEYNSEVHQEDLMMAYSYIDTNLPTFKTGVPVTLNMLHTLSALRFRFSFIDSDGTTYNDSDALTAFWLENTAHNEGLATTGMLAFGTYNDDGTLNGEHIHWFYEDYPEPSTSTQQRPFFVWEDTNGVEFASTTTQRTIATAYSTNADGNQRYSNNNGYVLVIPQETNGSTMMCFRLKSTGDLVHRVALPATDYDAGKRYTYDIRFGRTQATVKLTIAEWNELKSSQDIPL